ncbi:MAG: type I DNA topoisomerase [Bacillota bacterium]
MGIDVEDGFTPKYITIRGKGKVLKDLRKLVSSCDRVLLATDPDREGEAIAWHLIHALSLDEDSARVAFNEITGEAIRRALKSPRPIDQSLVDAQQARRILDRLVGYKLSPLLWRKVRRGLSAGRVQSAAVRMIVEREREREAFEPEEYWTLDAEFASPAGEEFAAHLAEVGGEEPRIPDEEAMNGILQRIPREGWTADEVERKETKRYPAAAFTTSSMQQAASRRLGMNGGFAMRVAQQLYEGLPLRGDSERTGLITYMRTDSTRVSEMAVGRAEKFIRERYGAEFSEPRVRRGRARRGAEEAHEAIRPADVSRTPESLKKDLNNSQYRLYRLIWERFVASQMKPAIYDEVEVTIRSGDFGFLARGRQLKFPGFLILNRGARNDDSLLPPIRRGDEIELLELMPKQNFTSPPSRYNEATLVKALEEEGIGRPSTYAPIVETIQKRGYVGVEDKHFFPTELGRAVNDLLEEHFPDVVDLNFTREMETQLDSIEEGETDWDQVIGSFWEHFSENLRRAYEDAPRVKLPEKETDVICEECGARMVIKHGRYGKFLACPRYPECKNSKPYFEKTGAQCPECGGDVVKKRSRKGRVFYGCANYPECEFVVWHEPTGEVCPECGAFMVRRRTRRKGEYLQCARKECGFERLPADEMKVEGN